MAMIEENNTKIVLDLFHRWLRSDEDHHLVAQLLERDPFLARNSQTTSPLQIACHHLALDNIQCLLQHGANPNKLSDGVFHFNYDNVGDDYALDVIIRRLVDDEPKAMEALKILIVGGADQFTLRLFLDEERSDQVWFLMQEAFGYRSDIWLQAVDRSCLNFCCRKGFVNNVRFLLSIFKNLNSLPQPGINQSFDIIHTQFIQVSASDQLLKNYQQIACLLIETGAVSSYTRRKYPITTPPNYFLVKHGQQIDIIYQTNGEANFLLQYYLRFKLPVLMAIWSLIRQRDLQFLPFDCLAMIVVPNIVIDQPQYQLTEILENGYYRFRHFLRRSTNYPFIN